MSMDDPIAAAQALLTAAVQRRVFPAAVAEVGDSSGTLWREPFGTLTLEPASPPADVHTIFDLASLTKPIAITSIVMQLVIDGRLRLQDLISDCFEEWRGDDREPTTVQDLLEHSAGLAARLVDLPPTGRREFEHEICGMKLEYPRRTRSLYSDLGFILLGFLVADRGGASLATELDQILARLPETADLRESPHDFLGFTVPAEWVNRAAPTAPLDDDVRRGRLLIGEVHDSYAATLGGLAGHAGLFGTAPAVGAFARTVLRGARGDEGTPPPLTPALVTAATTRSLVPGSSRALGWDTMRPTSSCGVNLSAAAFGHVGFTGTSLWIDPAIDRYFVLLTNRVAGEGTTDTMQSVRRSFHDLLARL
jgi:CubicO group peptidase (beta-lactamase class C family)